MTSRWLSSLILVAGLAACPADDVADSGNSNGATTTNMTSEPSTSDGGCPLGSDGCACRPDSTCDPLLICVGGACEVDTESDSGPTTASASESSGASSTDGSADGSSDGSGSSGSDTGSEGCKSSADCPEGEVCIAPARSPGVPSEPFSCSKVCAGLGIDAAVCTDDASCCGAFCDQGSCLAP